MVKYCCDVLLSNGIEQHEEQYEEAVDDKIEGEGQAGNGVQQDEAEEEEEAYNAEVEPEPAVAGTPVC